MQFAASFWHHATALYSGYILSQLNGMALHVPGSVSQHVSPLLYAFNNTPL